MTGASFGDLRRLRLVGADQPKSVKPSGLRRRQTSGDAVLRSAIGSALSFRTAPLFR
ncbi:hypothetical protein V1282_000896 [Nitrobacteraceae bacterium AZCC 2146]